MTTMATGDDNDDDDDDGTTTTTKTMMATARWATTKNGVQSDGKSMK